MSENRRKTIWKNQWFCFLNDNLNCKLNCNFLQMIIKHHLITKINLQWKVQWKSMSCDLQLHCSCCTDLPSMYIHVYVHWYIWRQPELNSRFLFFLLPAWALGCGSSVLSPSPPAPLAKSKGTSFSQSFIFRLYEKRRLLCECLKVLQCVVFDAVCSLDCAQCLFCGLSWIKPVLTLTIFGG